MLYKLLKGLVRPKSRLDDMTINEIEALGEAGELTLTEVILVQNVYNKQARIEAALKRETR